MKVRDGSVGVLIFLLVVFIGSIFVHEKAKNAAEQSAATTNESAQVTDSIEGNNVSRGAEACDAQCESRTRTQAREADTRP
jgi:hypothetical protein